MSAGRSVSGTGRVDGAVPSSRISPASSGRAVADLKRDGSADTLLAEAESRG